MNTRRVLCRPHNDKHSLHPPSAGSLVIDGGKEMLGIHCGPRPDTLPEQSQDLDTQAANGRGGWREEGAAEIANEARGN